MKARVIIMGIALMAAGLVGCTSNKQITQQEMGNREIQLPCNDAGKDSKEYFSGMGVGENVNMQNARVAALQSAKQMIQLKIGGMVKGLNEAYSKTVSGGAQQDDVSRVNEGDFVQVVERMLNDVEAVCEKMYQTPSGTYQSHIAIRISKEELAKNVATKLTEDDKLRTEYDRERFRKFAEEYMKNLEGEDK